MDQHIGITFGAEGQGQIVGAVTTIEGTLKSLNSTVASVASSLRGAFSGASKMVSGLESKVASLNRELRGLASSSQKLQGAQAVTPNVVSNEKPSKSSVAGTDKGAKKPSADKSLAGRAASQSGVQPFYFMGRYMAAGAALGAGSYYGKNALLGGAREELAKNLSELSNVSFTSADKAASEGAARKFSSQFWKTSQEDYLKAMYEAGSAVDINEWAGKLGSRGKAQQMMQKVTEDSMLMASTAQMQAGPAAEMLMLMWNANKTKYEAAGKNPGDFTNEWAPKISKAIEIFQLKGKQLEMAQREALPIMAQQGWTPESMFGFLGTMRSTGMQPGKTGRFGRNELLKGPEVFARIFGLAEGLLVDTDKMLPGKQKSAAEFINKQRTEQLRSSFAKHMSQDFLGTAELVRDSYQKLIKSGMDPKKMKMMLQDAAPYATFFTPGEIEEIRKNTETIAKANRGEMVAKVMAGMQDTGDTLTRFRQAFHNSMLVTAKTADAGKDFLGGVSQKFENLSLAQGFMADNLGKHNIGSKEWNAKRAEFDKDITDRFGAGRGKEISAALDNELHSGFWGSGFTGIIGSQIKEGAKGLREEVVPDIQEALGVPSTPLAKKRADILDKMSGVEEDTYTGSPGAKMWPKLWNWLTSPGAISSSDEGGNLFSRAGSWFKNNSSYFSFKSDEPQVSGLASAPSEKREVVTVNPKVEVHVTLDGKELRSTILKVLNETATQNRATFGGTALGGLGLGGASR